MPVAPQILTAIEQPWTDIKPIRVGPAGHAERTPDRYVLFQPSTRGADLRIDLYFNSDEYNFKVDAIAWGPFLAVAAGESLYLVDEEHKRVLRHPLHGYFCELVASDTQLVIASAEQLLAVGADGSAMWRSEPLGIDGVVIHDVTPEVINGAGEWDPPGGWAPFAISRQSGKKIGVA